MSELISELQQEALSPRVYGDKETETDEMFANAGEKSVPHLDPDDPPRRRANRKRGHGTYANDRPPIVGTLGRESGQCRLRVYEDTKVETLLGRIRNFTVEDSICYTDDWQCYDGISQMGRIHRVVFHKPGAYKLWALDNDVEGTG